jgi:hypothetical protein
MSLSLQLPPKFQSHPECSVGIMTLEDAQFLIGQGWLTLEGAQFLFPEGAWDVLARASQASTALNQITKKKESPTQEVVLHELSARYPVPHGGDRN